MGRPGEEHGAAMNRPLRVTVIGSAVVLVAAAWLSLARGQDKQTGALKQRINNFSHENTVCGVYYTVVGVCLGKDRPNDAAAKQYLTSSNTFFERAGQTGHLAGVSAKAIEARTTIATEEMKEQIDDNCSNIAVLLQKYAKTCKVLIENAAERLDKMMR